MKRYLAAALLACTLNVFGQDEITLPFNEGFEHDGSMPEGWSQQYMSIVRDRFNRDSLILGNIHEKPEDLTWEAREGGGKPAGSEVTKPEHAHSGDYNARLYYLAKEHMHNMGLISPVLNFENVDIPLLTFWYSQYRDRASATDSSEIDNFEISLFYRILGQKDTTWQKIHDYKSPTDDDNPWVCDSVWLPGNMSHKKKVQLVFLGKTKSLGHGCCIDDIKIEETQITNKSVGNITATHPTTDIIPTSSNDNPVLRMRVQVLGNSGVLNLNSLTATVTQLKQKGNVLESVNAIKQNGVKLYFTESDIFTTDSLLATTSVSNGKATFNNITFNMPPSNNNYLWITCDIDDDNEHRFRNVKVDIKIEPESINIGGLKYPASELNPASDRTINESIFVDDFEDENHTNSQWPIWEGEFERAKPQGLGGNGGNADPTYAHGGNWIIGTDITGNGYNPGGIEIGIGSDECYVETKPFDCYYYKGISLVFYRWLNICDLDTAYVSISTDEGASWENVWTSTSTILNKSWTYQNLDLKNVADRTQNIKLRFSLGSSSNDREQSMLAYSGWNIDDVALVGTFVYMDAAVTDIVYPVNDCGLDMVKPIIKIKNAGFNKIETPFTAEYSIDGGKTWVSETVTAPIEREDDIEYEFNTAADLSRHGWYDIRARVVLTDDEDNRNNNAQKKVISLPTLDLPYAENFSTYGYWYNSGDSTWQYTKLDGESYCWTTRPSNNICTLESPCFDMSNVQKPIVEFRMKGHSNSTDGLALYYSTDASHQTWNLVPNYPIAYPHASWSWYNEDNIAVLESSGWNGYFDNWTRFMQLLPDAVGGQSSVKLKFVFKAEDAESDYSFSIDDIRMYESPVDAGVVAVVNPTDDCHLLKEQPITIRIKNFGNRAITPADSLIASTTVNDKITLIDTFFVNENIAPEGFYDYTFGQTVNMWYKKTYTINATTLIKGDTLLFSNASNDALPTLATATVLGEPQYDLGADMGTTDPEEAVLDGGVKSDGSNFNGYQWFESKEAFLAGTPLPTEEKILTGLRAFEPEETEYYYYIKVKTIAGGKECFETDSIKVINSQTDVGISSVSGLKVNDEYAFCRKHEFNNVTVTVTNFSDKFAVEQGFNISICYKILDADNNWITHEEPIILSEELPRKAKDDENQEDLGNNFFEYTFKQQPKFEFDGPQSIDFFTLIYADLDHSNNTLTKDITVWPLPAADLGADSVLTANPATIPGTLTTEAISGAKYIWNGNNVETNENSYTISELTTAEYKVEVIDKLHNCPSATDKVLIVSDNWNLAELISPTDNCDPISGVDVTVRIKNNGPNTYAAGYRIPATVTFNGNTFNEIITLSKNLTAGDDFVHTFTTKVDMPRVGAYNLNVKINPEHDINRNDNILNQEIDIWGIPRLNIGPDTIFTLRPDTVKLHVSSSFNGCHWYHGFTAIDFVTELENKFTCIPSGNIYIVYAINEHECYDDDQKTDKYESYAESTETGYCATDTVIIIKSDISIESIESPIAACDIASFNTVKLTLRNSGLDVINNGTKLPIMIKIDDNEPVRENYVIQTPFDPYNITESDLTAVIPFDFNFDKSETYKVSAWLDWNMDRFHENDTVSTIVSQYPNPDPFYLGDDIYTTSPDTVVLHAPANYYNYSWTGGQSNSDVFAVSYIGTRTYGVRVSNQYGCSYADSLVVSLTKPKIDITELGFGTDICESESLTDVSFTLKNIGADIIAKGSQIDIEYSLGESTIKEVYKVGRTLTSGESVAITFRHQADFRSAGSYALNVKASIADSVAVSSKDFTVTVHESPKMSLGNDIRTFESSVSLTPGSGFSSYLWNTGATTDKITVSEDGKYWVKVTNSYGCSSADTANVHIIPAKVTIDRMKQPQSACSLDNEPIEITIVNNGTTKIEKSSTIGIRCYVDGGTPFTKTLSQDFDVKMSFDQRLDSLLTIDAPGTHHISFVITIDNAIIDSTAFEFEIYGQPDFDFESDEINVGSYPFTLAPTTSLSGVSYEWSTSAKSNAIDVTADGTYTLTVTDSHQCATTKSVKVKMSATGIGNATIADITVYPNPARDIVNIDFDGMLANGCQILIANASGQIIFASRQTDDIMQIAVDDWAPGMYFIKITSNNETRIIKFVKE